MAKVRDFDHKVSEFELQLHYYVHFRKGIKLHIPSAVGLIVSSLFFCKNDFGIKYPTKLDMPLNKSINPNQSFLPKP